MSVPIVTQYLSGRTVYAVVWNPATGLFWNKDTAAWESYSQGNWLHYALALTEYISSGIYQAAYPAGIAAGVLSTEFIYQQNGATPVLPALPGGDSFLTLGQSQGSNLQTIAGDGAAAIGMAAAADLIIPAGVVVSGSITATSFRTNLTNAQAQAYVGRIIGFKTGACAGQETNVTGYVVSNGVLTVTALTTAPAAGDVFVML
jgi:hypothetical protein